MKCKITEIILSPFVKFRIWYCFREHPWHFLNIESAEETFNDHNLPFNVGKKCLKFYAGIFYISANKSPIEQLVESYTHAKII